MLQLTCYECKIASQFAPNQVFKTFMKITGFRVYQVDLPLHEGNYAWSEGKSVDVFDSTVVADRYGRRNRRLLAKSARWGRSICRPTQPGARAGIQELAPHLLGDRIPLSSSGAQPQNGSRHEGPPVRQVGDRHGVLGHSGQGSRAAGLSSVGRPVR